MRKNLKFCYILFSLCFLSALHPFVQTYGAEACAAIARLNCTEAEKNSTDLCLRAQCADGGNTTSTTIPATEIACPTYTQPVCRTDQEAVTVTVPQEFQRTGCATTMPVCKNLPQTSSTIPSRQCGENQKFNNTSGQCENTNVACPAFMRLCTVGETPDQLCSCSPTEASVRGPLPCVAALSCPDNRLLNCDATRQTAVRNCFVQVSPTVVTTTTTVTPTVNTDPAKLCQVEYSERLSAYNAQIPDDNVLAYATMMGAGATGTTISGQTRNQMLLNMIRDPNSQSRFYIPNFDFNSAAEWYADWIKRCEIYFPTIPNIQTNPNNNHQGGTDNSGDGAGGGQGGSAL